MKLSIEEIKEAVAEEFGFKSWYKSKTESEFWREAVELSSCEEMNSMVDAIIEKIWENEGIVKGADVHEKPAQIKVEAHWDDTHLEPKAGENKKPMGRMKIEHFLGSGETYLISPDGNRKRVVCYDIKIQDDHSEARIFYWPSKKADRKRAKEHFKETGEILDLNPR